MSIMTEYVQLTDIYVQILLLSKETITNVVILKKVNIKKRLNELLIILKNV
jgi:hypothetical protein